MAVFGVDAIAPQVRSQLAPGETALAYEYASMMGSADFSGRRRKAGRAGRAREHESLGYIEQPAALDSEESKLEARIAGVGAEGQRHAIASAMYGAIDNGAYLLLTHRRLLVINEHTERIGMEVLRSQVHSARPTPRFGQLGRIEITFTDGSRVRPMLGMLWPGAARRFLRALRTGSPQS